MEEVKRLRKERGDRGEKIFLKGFWVFFKGFRVFNYDCGMIFGCLIRIFRFILSDHSRLQRNAKGPRKRRFRN